MNCNHYWRDNPSPAPKQTVEELFESVKNAGVHGWWLRGIEYDLATELIEKGLVQVCEGCKNRDSGSQALYIKGVILN